MQYNGLRVTIFAAAVFYHIRKFRIGVCGRSVAVRADAGTFDGQAGMNRQGDRMMNPGLSGVAAPAIARADSNLALGFAGESKTAIQRVNARRQEETDDRIRRIFGLCG